MKKKLSTSVLLSFIAILCISIVSCANTNITQDTKNSKSRVEESVNETELVSSQSYNPKFDFTPAEAEINLNLIISTFRNNGFEPKKVNATSRPYDAFFSVPQTELLVNGGSISIYQYEINGLQKMKNDFNTIHYSGYVIQNNIDNWLPNFHLYRKGRVFVVYDGNDTAIINLLNSILK